MEIEKVMEQISAQQKPLKEGSAAWCVGEQLKDIVQTTPGAAELVSQDLEASSMGIVDCEKKIAAFAKAHINGNCGFCGPADADRIIREFYGIPAGEITEESTPAEQITPSTEKQSSRRQRKSLADFM